MQRVVIASQGARRSRKRSFQRVCGKFAMLEGIRDSLAHQGIDARCVARKQHPIGGKALPRGVPPDRKRLVAAMRGNRQAWKCRGEGVKQALLRLGAINRLAWALIVDAHVNVWPSLYQRGKRP